MFIRRSGIIFVALLFHWVAAKIYNKCELAIELRDWHSVPYDQIGILVCIAMRQSNFNTETVNDDSYFGMYQISGEFWCDRNYAGKACGVQCSSLTDDDISDDIRCVQAIFDEHTRLFGNGWNAWPSAEFCESQGNSIVQECFEEDNQTVKIYEPVVRQEKASVSDDIGKVYERCELARELHYQHNMQMDEVAMWVCIAKHESSYNTSAIGRLNADGSEDHGLFQISDIYWCGESGKACGVQCEEMRDNDISNDIKCIKQIHEEHTRLSGDGYTAWAVYPRCIGQSASFAEGCFDSDNEISIEMPEIPNPGIQQPAKPPTQVSKQRKVFANVEGEGKVYEKCDLARELHDRYDMPMAEVAMWVCIAKHESSYNTSAIGRLNADGSEDHGLFQISDIYWCGVDGKACGMRCEDLRDNDISNDITCIKQIHEEHTKISGDGFTAWAVYPRCKGQADQYIDGCFDPDNDIHNEIMPYTPVPGVKQPTKTYVQVPNERRLSDKSVETGKVYERCELAQELRFKHKIPMEQVASWVCIAKHESSFNTSAIGRRNVDGSEDHGLFQISDIYWCSQLDTVDVKACDLPCSKLEDSDISDDVECVLKIWDEHQRLFGDGFNAWAVWPRCKDQSSSWIDGCFGATADKDSAPRPAVTQPPKTTNYEPSTTTQATTTTVKITTTIRPPAISAEPIKTSVNPTITSQAPRTIPTTTQRITKPSTTLKPKAITTTLKPKAITTTTRRIATIKPSIISSTNKAITTISNLEKTAAKDTTIKALELVKLSTKPTTAKNDEDSTTTVKSFNIFDLYFNSFPKSPNEIKKHQLTKSDTKTTTKAPVKTTTAYVMKTNGKVKSTTTRGKALENPQTEKSVKISSATAGRTASTIVSRRMTSKPTRTSQETTRKVSVAMTKSTAKPSSTQTKRKTVTPFNVFDFYLNDYASKAPIVYRPVIFSDRSRVIILPSDENSSPPLQKSSTTSLAFRTISLDTTTRWQDFKIDSSTITNVAVVNPHSFLNPFGDYNFNKNQKGREVHNITPHNFDYLVRLTTPRTPFNRS